MRRAAVVLSTLMFFAATQVFAVGLGSVTLESALNQPLRARIELLDLGGVRPEDITVQLASEEDFQRFSVERSAFLNNIDFRIEQAGGLPFVAVTSTQAVREPYLSFILDTRWSSGRILSEHTVLLDLPVFTAASTVQDAIVQPVSPLADPQGVVERQVPGSRPAAQAVDAAAALAPPQAPEAPAQPGLPDTGAATRSASNVAAEPATLPETLETRTSDTLWEIALRVRPDSSLSVQQTMLAIQRLNPDAFIDGNINRLRAGEVLRIPDLAEIQSISRQQAVSEVVRQNSAANLGVQPLAPAPAAANPTGTDGSGGQLRVLTVDDTEPASPGSGAALVEENEALDARIRALENQLALQEESADRASIQQEELRARLADLEAQIASAAEIITLQDQRLAQLQQSLAQAAAAAVAPGPVSPARSASLTDRLLQALSSSSFIFAALILVVVLLTVMMLVRRSRQAAVAGPFGGRFETVAGRGDERVARGQSFAGSQVQGFSALDEEYTDLDEAGGAARSREEIEDRQAYPLVDEEVVEEVDDSGLEDLLTDYDEPTDYEDSRPAIDAKQADLDSEDEIQALDRDALAAELLVRQDSAAADQEALDQDELEDVIDYDLDELVGEDRRAADEDGDTGGLDFDLDELLDADNEPLEATDIDVGAAIDSAANDAESEAADMTLEFEPAPESSAPGAAHDADAGMGIEFSGSLAGQEPAAESAGDEEIEFESVDFDLGDSAADEPQESVAGPAEDESIEKIEFGFGATRGVAASGSQAEPLAVDTDQEEASEPVDFALDDPAVEEELDLTLEDEADPSAMTRRATAWEAVSDKTVPGADRQDASLGDDAEVEEVEDIEFIDDIDEVAEVIEEDRVAAGSTITGELNDLEFLTADTGIDLEEDEEDFDFLSGDEEAATKLDLAYAYQKMGDLDGAKEILEEVIREGNSAQANEARSLLASLAK